MANVFVFAESRGGALRKVALEAVSAARAAADATGGGEVHALLIGAAGITRHAEPLGRYGADRVVVVEHPALERYNAEVFAATAVARIKAGSYRAGFFSASAEGRDLAPRVAAALGVPLAADVTSIELTETSRRSRSRVPRRWRPCVPARFRRWRRRGRHRSSLPRPPSIRHPLAWP